MTGPSVEFISSESRRSYNRCGMLLAKIHAECVSEKIVFGPKLRLKVEGLSRFVCRTARVRSDGARVVRRAFTRNTLTADDARIVEAAHQTILDVSLAAATDDADSIWRHVANETGPRSGCAGRGLDGAA